MKKNIKHFTMTNGRRLSIDSDYIISFFESHDGSGRAFCRIISRNNNFDVQETYDQVVEIVTYGNRFTKREA